MDLNLTPEQIERISALQWYHSLNLGKVRTESRLKPPLRPNATLFGVMDLLAGIDVAGMRCLDVGTAHGLIAAGLAMLDGKVSATDIGATSSPQIDLISEIYGIHIDYCAPVHVETIQQRFAPATFDLIVCAGVMYHLLSPADVFIRLRPLLKRGGLLVIESAYSAKTKEPVLVLNSETGDYSEPTTYFLPSAAVMVGLAKLACLDVLATRVCSPARFALVGRAVLPKEVQDRAPQTETIHEFGISDPSFHYAELADHERSAIEFNGTRGHAVIDMETFKPSLPSHPDETSEALGGSATAAALKAFLSPVDKDKPSSPRPIE